MTPTKKQIERQIKGLEGMKKWLPEKNYFGDNNWEKIDAQISILRREKSANHFYKGNDDIDIYSDARDAEEWLNGERKEDLFETEQ